MDPQVKACPFCGDDDPSIDEVDVGIWALCCDGCGATGPIENFASGAKQPATKAIELWNKRP